jgi:hypothetical protein
VDSLTFSSLVLLHDHFLCSFLIELSIGNVVYDNFVSFFRASNSLLAKKEKYNFETVHNIDPYGSDFVRTFRGGIKCWNMCIQYWLAVNVYKQLPRNQFRYRKCKLSGVPWMIVF